MSVNGLSISLNKVFGSKSVAPARVAAPVVSQAIAEPEVEVEQEPEQEVRTITVRLNVEFEFTNTGTEMLIIKNVTASCGCTIPEKPEEPIAPGNTGKIKATFDSRGRAGMNQKVITVVANTKETIHTLIFDVDVENPQYAK